MNRLTFHRSIFFAGLMAASAAFAGSDIVKCVDPDGHATLTDSACASGASSEPMAAPAELAEMEAAPAQMEAAPETPEVSVVAPKRVARAPIRVQHDNWRGKPAAGPTFSLDMATLKAARLNMQSMDHASNALRQQRLAALD